MRAVEINIYKFDELDKKVQEKVLDKFRENEDFSFLEDMLNDQITELLKEESIEEQNKTNVLYDLSYSQGSGVCFIGTFKMKVLDKEYTITIKHMGHYYHSKSVEFFIEVLGSDGCEDISSDIYVLFRDRYNRICVKLERIGYEEIEYRNSEENIIETIDNNDYEFYANGDMYYNEE